MMLLLQLLLMSGHRSGVSGRRRIHGVGVVKLGDMRCNDLALPFLSGVQDWGQKGWLWSNLRAAIQLGRLQGPQTRQILA